MSVKKKTARDSKENPTLTIKNFKSILELRLNPSRVNILFGRPNSGKSNILEALTLFNFIQPKILRQQQPTLIRYNNLDNLFYDRNIGKDVEVKYNNNLALLSYYPVNNVYLQILNPTSEYLGKKDLYYRTGLVLDEIQVKRASNSSFMGFYALLDENGQTTQSWPPVFLENPVRRYEFKDGISYSDNFKGYLKPFGENLFAIVQDNPEIKSWINSFFAGYNLEFLMDFSSKKFEVQKKENGIVYKIPFELTPDTLRRMLFYVAAIYSNKGATILIEEPESHTFPPYIKELTEMIKADKNNRYFITTHSPYFINSLIEDSLKIKDISFFHVYYEDYQSKVRKLSKKDLDNLWSSSADIFFNIDAFRK